MRWLKIIMASLAVFLIGNVVSNASGPSSGYTGAPNENNCTSCHSGSSVVTSGTQWNRVRMRSNIPSTGYLMDSTYTVTVTYAESGISTFGFQLTALSSDSSKAAGTFATTDARTQKNSGTVSGLTRNYIEHTATGNSKVATDSTSWVFKWKAPSKNMGSVTFYINVNAADGNGSSSGDVIYGKSFKISQSSKLPVATARLVDTPACASAFRFAGSATNSPTSFEWFTFDASGKYKLLSNKQNPTLSQLAGSVKNVIYFKAYNSLGESNTVKLTYTVNDSPVKSKVSPTGLNYICSGDSLKITAISQSALGYTQRWLPVNNSKLSIFVKDSGLYFCESKNKIGCITYSDTIRLSIKKRPTVSAEFTPSKSAYCVGSLIILKAKGSFADSFGTNVKGPFKTDTMISFSAKLGNTFTNVYSKSSNGCVSSAVKKSYVVADSSTKVIAATFDLSLTAVTFKWFAQTSAVQYEVSKDSGKTWTKTGNSGKDTFYNVSAANAYSLLKLWVRYTVNTDCGISPIAAFSSYTNACQEVKYTISTDKIPSCVGQNQDILFGDLPQKYSIWVNGQPKGQINRFTVPIYRKNTPLYFHLLDSSQLVCGYFKNNYSLLADSLDAIKSSWEDWTDSSVFIACENPVFFEVFSKGDVAKVWTLVNNKKSTIDLTKIFQRITVTKGDTLQLFASSPQGCSVYSKKMTVDLISKPDASFSYNSKKIGDSAFIDFIPRDTMYSHRWYIVSSPTGWYTEITKPTLNSYKFRDLPSILIHHEILAGFNCTTYDTLTIDLLPYYGSTNMLSHILFAVYPNPQKGGGDLTYQSSEPIKEFVLFDAVGKRVKCENVGSLTTGHLNVPNQSGIYILQCKTLSGFTIQKQIQIIE